MRTFIRMSSLFLTLAFATSPVAAADAIVCKNRYVMETLGPRPMVGSGIALFWIDLTFRAPHGEHLLVKEIYLGGDQPFPRPGAVCTICYQFGRFPGVIMPKANILKSISCPGQMLGAPFQ